MVVPWLIGAGVGPAAVALPVNWAADALAGSAQHWFKRLHRADDLSRLVKAATGSSVDLTHKEFSAVRKLLEDQETWRTAGRGTIEDLAERIALCLPPRPGRTADESQAAAMTIARGLLEFVVADLDPKLFQQVLLTRLQRMETDQATALDAALLNLHADLLARLTVKGELDDQRFGNAIGHLKQVLDRLPPGPASQGEIVVYLKVLIDWLNLDPWPTDRRLNGPMLTPGMMERKMRVTSTGPAGELDVEADELAKQCSRLVVLGGPGSGKTWLARRAARCCAEDALEALAAGRNIDEVELPLYTTCSLLFATAGDIRHAVVTSALDHLGDLGSARLTAAISSFFAERNAPTLLVIDSLDEAQGRSDRLRQADTLPWRIFLTSRPSSWNHQLVIDDENDSHSIGELQSLRFPEDVKPFVLQWFQDRPEWGEEVIAQITRYPDIQQAATIPLILAFYCIVGGGEPLPRFRRDLYAKVINRMLTGRWRGLHDDQPDVNACLRTLRAWAWSGAVAHPISGIGIWPDSIPTERAQLDEADKAALNHIATPLGPPDPDTDQTLRRFTHRSLREYLVAEYVSRLAVDQAVEILLPHIWYDPDWEYSASAALAMHPQHDQVLRGVICRAAKTSQLPDDLSVIDAGGEFRRLLARVATESGETDWSPYAAGIIGQARVELATSGRTDDLGGAAHWETSSRQARETLLGALVNQTYSSTLAELVNVLAQLAATEESKDQVREALLGLLARRHNGWMAARLVDGVLQLDPTAEEMGQAQEVLLSYLANETDDYVIERLLDGIIRLARTTPDIRHTREALLQNLVNQARTHVVAPIIARVIELTHSAEDMREARGVLLQLLVEQSDDLMAGPLAVGLVELEVTAEEKQSVRPVFLKLLARQNNPLRSVRLVRGLVLLDPTAQDARRARTWLLRLLARPDHTFFMTEHLVGELIQLGPSAQDKKKARVALLRLLAQRNVFMPEGLVDGLIQLDPTGQDKEKARAALLKLLARQKSGASAAELAVMLNRLDPAAEDMKVAREVLLEFLDGRAEDWMAGKLVDALNRLDPSAEDEERACEVVLGLLARQADGSIAAIGGMIELTSTMEHQERLRVALLRLLADQTNGSSASPLMDGVIRLASTSEHKKSACGLLLSLLTRSTDKQLAQELTRGLVELSLTPSGRRTAREILVGLLAEQTNGTIASHLVDGLMRLSPTEAEKEEARAALLRLLAGQASHSIASQLTDRIIQLSPTARDLVSWHSWRVSPTTELMAEVRWNSSLQSWVSVIPSLVSVSS